MFIPWEPEAFLIRGDPGLYVSTFWGGQTKLMILKSYMWYNGICRNSFMP